MLYKVLETIAPKVLDPSFVLLVLLVGAALFLGARRPRTAGALVFATIGLILFVSLRPLPQLLLVRPLEERFPVWRDHTQAVTGIIVLGGGLNVDVASWRPGSGLASPSSRITETVYLAGRFHEAKVLYSGGGRTPSEAEEGRILLARLGVDPSRILVETKSRTTAENATFSRELVKPQSGQRWIVVTSAFHMPRAMGAFRKAGFPVEAYPVDYRAYPSELSFDLPGGLDSVKLALKEYVGLLAYWVTGRGKELFPGPEPG